MKTPDCGVPRAKPRLRPTAFFLCAIFACWIVGSLYMELRLGWPASRADWGHRVIGWFVNAVFIRTFLRGLGRYRAAQIGMA